MSNNRRTIFTPDRDLIVRGNLTVQGNTIVVSQDELRINDDVIIINNDLNSPNSTLKMFSSVNGYGATITYAGANMLISNTVQAGLYVPAGKTFLVEPDAVFSGNIAAQNFLGTITASNTANSFTAPITLNLTGDVVGSTSFQFAGEVANISTNLSIDSVQLGSDTAGNYVAQVTAGNGISVIGGVGETANLVVSHYLPDFVADSTSNINTGANVIQSLSLDFDEFGHTTNVELSSIDLDDRYYTESELDDRLNFKADKSLSISAGAGLFYSAGAGTLAANFTLAVGAGTGIVSNPDNVAVTLSPFSTTDLSEGSNLYFTVDRVRSNISVSGDLTYDQANGVIGYQERSDQEIRDLFSATSNILYDANTGVISHDLFTTDIVEGINLYFTVDRVRSNISVSGNLTYDQANGVIGFVQRTDQEIRDLFSVGNGLVYNSSVGEFSVNTSQLVTVADDQIITGDKTFTGNVDLTGAITSVTSGILPTVNTTTWIYTLGSNDGTIANTQYVETAVENRIQSLISGSPAVLDTLQEIADSLNNDPNLANTLTSLINTKADKVITLFGGEGVDVNSGNSADLSANIIIDVDDTVVRTTGDQFIQGSKQFANNIVVSDIVLDVANNDGFVQITNNGANSSLPSMSFHDSSYVGGEFVDVTTSQFQVSGTVRAGELEVAGAYTLPTADGTDGDVLTTLGNGTVVFKSGVTGNNEDATISGDRTFTGNVVLSGNTQVLGELTLSNTTNIDGDVSVSALLETDNTVIWYQDTLGSNTNISISANSVTFSGAADTYANGVGRAHEIDFGNTTVYIGSSDRKGIYTDGTDRTLEYLSVDSGIVLGPSRSNVLQDGAIYYDNGQLYGVQAGNAYPLIQFSLTGQIFTNDASDAQPIKSIANGNYYSYGFAGGTNITVSEPGGNVVQIDGLSNAEIISVSRSGITATGNITFDQNTGIISQGLFTNDISEGTNLFYTDERVDERVANLIVAGSNIALDYDDANSSLTIGVDLDGLITGVFGANGITGGGTSGDVTLELDPSVAGDGVTFTSGVIDVVGGDGITVNADNIQLSNSGVTAGTYGSDVAVPEITVDQYGRITSVSNTAITVDNYVNWSFTTDTAGNVGVFSGNVVTISGGNNIDVTHNASTRTITISTPSDITSVLSGEGLSGGGTSGDVTLSLNPAVAGNGLIYASGVLDVGAGTGIDVAANTISANLSVFSTTDLAEGNNLYFTNERVDDRVANLLVATSNITVSYDDGTNTITLGQALTTDDVVEGANLYYTSARANTAIDARVNKAFVDALNVDADTLDGLDSSQFIRSDQDDTLTGNLTVTGNIDAVLFTGELVGNVTGQVSDISNFTTTDLAEGANLYYSNSRVQSYLSSGDATDISIDGNIAITGDLNNVRAIQFDITRSDTPEVGQVCWNNDDGTLDLGMAGGNVVLQMGQETLVLATNATGNTISNGTVVRITGAQNGNILVAPIDVTSTTAEYSVVGMATEDIPDDSKGYVTHFGVVREVDTSGFLVGDLLYVDPDAPGGLTANKPESPNVAIVVGTVLDQDASNGSVFVNLFQPDIASEVTYNNDVSGLTATNVQSAIDELQLEKASVDALSSTITIYPTTANSDISGYLKMVSSIDDVDYDDPAVNVSTGAISGAGQLIASLASEPGLFVGNPGVINVTTLGNIRRTSGFLAAAEFYFEMYQRSASNVETLVGTSSTTSAVTSGTYVQFSASGSLNNGNWTETDRVVIKYYANKTGVGGDPVYDFQFGGDTPVRTLIPVPVRVIPASDAGNILVDTSNFDNKLSGADSTVQLALDTLDDHVHTTSEITEGSRLYYTNERVDDRVNALLQTTGNLQFTYDDGNGTLTLSESLTTDDVVEGANLYYTVIRANAAIDARVNKAFVDALNVDADTLDGLDSSQFIRSDQDDTLTGNLTVTGNVNAAAFTGELVGNVTGQVSDISNFTTTDLAEGANLYYTDARARAAISSAGNILYDANTGIISESLTTDDIIEGANLYYTDTRVQEYLSSGISNVTVNGNLNVSGGVINLGNAITQQADDYVAGDTTPLQVLDVTPAANVSSIKYFIQAVSATDTHVSELTVIHNNGVVYYSEFGITHSGNTIYTAQADLDSGNIRVQVNPTAAATFDLFKTVFRSPE